MPSSTTQMRMLDPSSGEVAQHKKLQVAKYLLLSLASRSTRLKCLQQVDFKATEILRSA